MLLLWPTDPNTQWSCPALLFSLQIHLPPPHPPSSEFGRAKMPSASILPDTDQNHSTQRCTIIIEIGHPPLTEIHALALSWIDHSFMCTPWPSLFSCPTPGHLLPSTQFFSAHLSHLSAYSLLRHDRFDWIWSINNSSLVPPLFRLGRMRRSQAYYVSGLGGGH